MRKVIFTLKKKDPLATAEGEVPFSLDAFHLSEGWYDFPKDVDWSKVPEDLNPVFNEAIKRDIQTGFAMRVRQHFDKDSYGVFILGTTNDNYSREDLEAELDTLFKGGILKEFLDDRVFMKNS